MMLKIPWTAHTSNDNILQMIDQKQSWLRTIEERKNKFVDHIIRKSEVEEGKVLGSRSRGGQRKMFLEDFNMKPQEIWDLARDHQM